MKPYKSIFTESNFKESIIHTVPENEAKEIVFISYLEWEQTPRKKG